MKKLALSLTLSSAVFLGSCATSQIDTFVSDVQAAATTICGAVPEVSAVVALWNVSVGETAQLLAQDICTAVLAVQTPPVAAFRVSANRRRVVRLGPIQKWTPRPVEIRNVAVTFI